MLGAKNPCGESRKLGGGGERREWLEWRERREMRASI